MKFFINYVHWVYLYFCDAVFICGPCACNILILKVLCVLSGTYTTYITTTNSFCVYTTVNITNNTLPSILLLQHYQHHQYYTNYTISTFYTWQYTTTIIADKLFYASYVCMPTHFYNTAYTELGIFPYTVVSCVFYSRACGYG